MKKILSLILAGLMTVSCAAFVSADDAAAEVVSDPAEVAALEFLHNVGIWKGVDENEFVADAESMVQRYQMALLVSRIATGWLNDTQWMDGNANDATFEDINDEPASKYWGALSYANENGIIEGYSSTTFAPYDGITHRDALAMVLRTMGYTNLNYPWGYIEKAVELGLNEGVDAVYTAELRRGEVAQILYNALFAPTKSGETLAKSVFGYDYGWETIVVVASDEAAYNNIEVKTGYIAFQVLNTETGALEAPVYYLDADELGLSSAHADDLAVGSAYLAMFTIDGKIADLVDGSYTSLELVPVVNAGITNNAGETTTLPVAGELGKYVVTADAWDVINYGKYYQNEALSLYTLTTKTIVVGKDEKQVGIDWKTGDIMEWNETTKTWDTAWYYNETLDKYYQYFYNDVEDGIAINWMSEAEFTTWYAEAVAITKTYANAWTMAAAAPSATAYAKLRLWDVNSDGNAELGQFKNYAIGYISVGSKTCGINSGANHTSTKIETYKIVDLDGNTVYEQIMEEKDAAHDHKANGAYAWLNVDPSVTTFEGTGLVIYDVNQTTGEIEIVKHIITGGDDEDSFFVSGVLQAYSTKGAYVIVDGEEYDLGYKELLGNRAVYGGTNAVNKDLTTRATAGEELIKYQMQYVTLTVVDGRVVDIDMSDPGDVIISLGYAGITSDGYIAVYGYSTFDTGVNVYKIASYNGWRRGDYKYNPENAIADNAFEIGALYEIKSIDTSVEGNAYNVFTQNVEDAKAEATLTTVTFDRGYRIQGSAVEAMAAADKYIVVYDNGTIFVKDGIVTDTTWNITAPMKDLGSTLVFYVDAAELAAGTQKVTGFTDDAHDLTYVLYEGGKIGTVLESHYDETIGGIYLLGSTLYEFRATNLLTGKNDTFVAGSNVVLETGKVYVALDGQILYETTMSNVLNSIALTYAEKDLADATYIVKDVTGATKANLTNDTYIAKALGIIVEDASMSSAVTDKLAAAYIGDNKGNFTLTEANGVTTLAAETLTDTGLYDATIIFETATKNYIVYINDDYVKDSTEPSKKVVKGEETVEEWIYTDYDEKIASELVFSWAGTKDVITYTDGKSGTSTEEISKTINLNAVHLNFDSIAMEHDDIEAYGFLFGMADDHGKANFADCGSYIRAAKNDVVAAEKFAVENIEDAIVFTTYDCEECDMVKGVSAYDLGITLENGDVATVRFYIASDLATVEVAARLTNNDGEIAIEFYTNSVVLNGSAEVAEIIA